MLNKAKYRRYKIYMVQKPFDLALVDTRDLIIKNINDSKLPLTAISMLLTEINKILEIQIESNLKILRSEYEKNLKEDSENGDKQIN
jgi:hypothetical protein